MQQTIRHSLSTAQHMLTSLRKQKYWLREKFGEIGVIQYENWVDIEEEVDAFAITRELEAESALG